MTVQRTPQKEPAPVPLDGPSPAELIERLPSDYDRATWCRHQAERCRRMWYAGRREQIEYVRERAFAGDRRFRRFSLAELDAIGKYRWSHSEAGQRLRQRERTFTEWARMYQSSVETDALESLQRGVDMVGVRGLGDHQ